MCTGILTLAYTGLQIASGLAQSRALKAEGQATNNYYQYQANVAEQNALLAERTGTAQSRAIQDVQKYQGRQLKTSQAEFRASQQAALAASGISGVTASDIDKNTMTKQALDENTLRFNADTRSYEAITGAQNQAFGLRTQATGFRYAGANALSASKIAARNSLLGTAVNVLSPFAFTPFKSNFAVPGMGGYGFSTPIGTRNMGTFSRLPGR